MTSSESKELTTPFENIALGFSGGGFRAASFSLGAISYLHQLTFSDHVHGAEVPLLSKVKYLSSASGGTIVTLLFSLYNKENKSFDEPGKQLEETGFKEFYTKVFHALETDKLLTEVLNTLNDDSKWKDGKRRNFINAFAKTYDEYLFNGKTIGDLKRADSQLEEICFNTTEFYRGILFRQTVHPKVEVDIQNDQFLFGNFVLNLDHEAAQKLKLSDVLAASSCFPGGFEPIVFPNDFLYPGIGYSAEDLVRHLNIHLQTGGMDELKFLFGELTEEELNANRKILLADKPDRSKLVFKTIPKIGFMDGGITDNLGLDSMMKANQRKAEPFDLMMTNDVGTTFMDPYKVVDESTGFMGQFTIMQYLVLAGITLLTGIALLVAGSCTWPLWCIYATIIAGTLLTTVSVFVLGTLLYLYLGVHGLLGASSGLNLEKNFPASIIDKLLHNFSKTRINVILLMIKSRVTSLLILNTDVFLKRVRQLLYEEFFDSGKWKHRVKGNRVYDLAMSNKIHRGSASKLEPDADVQKVAEIAFNMATTLWFDKKDCEETHSQACLIACGQFTTCYNLLLYIERLKAPDSGVYNNLNPDYKSRLDQLEKTLLENYKKFNSDPFYLYNALGEKYLGKEFKPLKAEDIPFPKNFKGLSNQE